MKKRKFNKKKKKDVNIKRRFLIIGIIIISLFLVIIYRLYKVMYIDKDKYSILLNDLTNIITTKGSAPRGRIYDRSYNLLVDNKEVMTIYYKKERDITTSEELSLAYKLSGVLKLDYNKVSSDNLKVLWLLKNKEEGNNKITAKEWSKLKQRKLNLNDIEILKKSRITDDEINSLTIVDRKAAYLYYLMNRGYLYSEKVIKTANVEDMEIAYVVEHLDELKGINIRGDWERQYLYGDTFKSILGTISSEEQGLPEEEKEKYLALGYSLNDRVGISYLEKQYEDLLLGKKDKYRVVSRYALELAEEGSRGNDIVLSIDINLQQKVEEILKEEILLAKTKPNTKYFNKSFVVIQDPNTGEILAMSGKQAINNNGEYKIVDYTPGILTNPLIVGSVVKGASILVGYNNNIIDINEYQVDECIKILNTPKKCSHRTMGRINDIEALAMSSNVYQFKIAIKLGGGNYQYDGPLKIDPKAFDIYRNTYKEFGLGTKTEIDLPIESLGYKGSSTLPGHLLDFSMGQYDTYTPIQLSQYISTIANGGNRMQPHLLKEVHNSSNNEEIGTLSYKISPVVLNKINTQEKYLNRVKEGFYAVMNASYGIGKGYIDKKYSPAGKTGTSESFLDTNGDGVIDTETISSSFVGYAPSVNPRMSIVVASPDISYPNPYHDYLTLVTRSISKRSSDAFFELYP